MRFGLLNRTDGLVGALRTHNELIWVYVVDHQGVAVVSRCVHLVERSGRRGRGLTSNKTQTEAAFYFIYLQPAKQSAHSEDE